MQSKGVPSTRIVALYTFTLHNAEHCIRRGHLSIVE